MDVVATEEVSMDFMELLEKMLIEKYGRTLVEHANDPRNRYHMKNADGHASFRGSCGDTMQFWVKMNGDLIEKVSFDANGCEVTLAVGSMLTTMAKGKSAGEAMRITPEQIINALGGVPEDHEHCAALAKNSLCKALLNYETERKAAE